MTEQQQLVTVPDPMVVPTPGTAPVVNDAEPADAGDEHGGDA